MQLTMFHHRTTEKAMLLSADGELKNAVWLPLSQLTVTSTQTRHRRRVTMPEWLATKNKIV